MTVLDGWSWKRMRRNAVRRTTMYHTGAEAFFADWQTFTGSPTPGRDQPEPDARPDRGDVR